MVRIFSLLLFLLISPVLANQQELLEQALQEEGEENYTVVIFLLEEALLEEGDLEYQIRLKLAVYYDMIGLTEDYEKNLIRIREIETQGNISPKESPLDVGSGWLFMGSAEVQAQAFNYPLDTAMTDGSGNAITYAINTFKDYSFLGLNHSIGVYSFGSFGTQAVESVEMSDIETTENEMDLFNIGLEWELSLRPFFASVVYDYSYFKYGDYTEHANILETGLSWRYYKNKKLYSAKVYYEQELGSEDGFGANVAFRMIHREWSWGIKLAYEKYFNTSALYEEFALFDTDGVEYGSVYSEYQSIDQKWILSTTFSYKWNKFKLYNYTTLSFADYGRNDVWLYDEEDVLSTTTTLYSTNPDAGLNDMALYTDPFATAGSEVDFKQYETKRSYAKLSTSWSLYYYLKKNFALKVSYKFLLTDPLLATDDNSVQAIQTHPYYGTMEKTDQYIGVGMETNF